MGVSRLLKVTLIVPKVELNEVLRELSYFEYFHPLQKEINPQESLLASINLRALKLEQELSEIINQLELKKGSGLSSLLAKKEEIKEKRKARDWEDFVKNLELEARPIINEVKEVLKKREEAEKRHGELTTLKGALELISNFKIDLTEIKILKYFKAFFAITKRRNLQEIRASLPDALLFETPIGEEDSAFLIVVAKEEESRVDKTFKSFEIEPFSLPKDLPQTPYEGYKKVQEELENLEIKLKEIEGAIETLKEKLSDRLLILKESAEVVKEITDKVKRLEGMRFFSKLEGYIPAFKREEFKRIFSDRWLTFLEEFTNTPHSVKSEDLPILFTNEGYVKDFQAITMIQGPPKYTEPDPTPLISFFFPVFYGMMFGDFGGGLILFLIGLTMFLRGSRFIKGWGTIIFTSGLVAMITGLIIGEAFGVKVSQFLPFLDTLGYHPLLELVEREAGGSFAFNVSTIMLFLKLTFIIGIFHLIIGYILSIIKGFREGEKYDLFTDKIPTLILYISFIILGLALFSEPSSIMKPFELLKSNKSIPILNLIFEIPVSIAFIITAPLIIICAVILLISKPLGIKLGKIHEEESMGMILFMGFIEVFEKLIVFLSNTVSYTRLAILLFVHAALTLAIWLIVSIPPFNLLAIPIIIIGNIGIIALEGLIVYIQDLRLHLYEWFTKFYEGTGRLFTKIMPDLNYLEIEWDRS
ncbi:MAG: V-type ATPase 116kDa subunit family protein [Nitrososphaerales archaeon]